MKDSATVSIDVRELCGETAKIPERPGYVALIEVEMHIVGVTEFILKESVGEHEDERKSTGRANSNAVCESHAA